jgi:hypothetical protein
VPPTGLLFLLLNLQQFQILVIMCF